jgi:hypothetical protein
MDECSHRATPGSVVGDDYDRTGICSNCGCYVQSFYIDGDEDRRGRWSRWKLLRLIIQEEQDPWSELTSSTT